MLDPTGMSADTFYTECYVAFLDIMGFENYVSQSENDNALFSQLILALKEVGNIGPYYSSNIDHQTGERGNWILQSQVFSDCIVLFIPTRSKSLPFFLQRYLYCRSNCCNWKSACAVQLRLETCIERRIGATMRFRL
jgi:hypothetical protein